MEFDQEFQEQLRQTGAGTTMFGRFRQTQAMKQKAFRLIGFIWLASWVPIAVLSLVEGRFFDGTIYSFFGDPETQIRLLIALPILIMSRQAILGNIDAVMEFASRNLLSDNDRERIWVPATKRADTLLNSKWATISVLVLIAVGILRLLLQASNIVDGDEHTWFAYSVHDVDFLTWAGYWSIFVAAPIFQYFLFRITWIFVVWVWLIWKLASAELTLSATHADGMGGLGVMFMAQSSFILPMVSVTAILAGNLAFEIWDQELIFTAARYEMAVGVLIGLILLFGPLVLFMQDMVVTRRRGLIEYGIVGTALSERFRRQWVQGEEPSGTENPVDPSMMADYGGTYAFVSGMRLVPFTLRHVIFAALMLTSPFVVVLYTQMSLDQVVQRLLGILL